MIDFYLLKLDTSYCTSLRLVKDEQSMVLVIIDSFSVKSYLLNTYYVPGSGGNSLNKADVKPDFREFLV